MDSADNNCLAKMVKCNNCQKTGHVARLDREKPKNNTAKSNYLGDMASEEDNEESEPRESETEEIRQITQMNKVIADNNDHYSVEIKKTDKKIIIDTGYPVTIMPNISSIYHPEDNWPLKKRYQDVNKNEIQFLQKVWVILASKIDRTSQIWTNYSAKSHPNYQKTS